LLKEQNGPGKKVELYTTRVVHRALDSIFGNLGQFEATYFHLYSA